MLKSFQHFYILLIIPVIFGACKKYVQDIPGPTIYIPYLSDGLEVELNDTLVILPQITYDRNSKYEWLLDGVSISQEKQLKLIANELRTYNLTFSISGSNGSDTKDFSVETIINNNFQDLYLETDTFQNGKNNAEYISGLFKLNATYIDTFSWNGFAYANMYNKSLKSIKNSYSAYATAIKNDSVYIILHTTTGAENIIILNNAQQHTIKSLKLANSTMAYHAMKSGITNIVDKLGGEKRDIVDSVYVKITGYDLNNTITNSTTVLLGQYDRANDIEYILADWKTVGLTELGVISKLVISFHSTQLNDNNEILTPQYICIDDIKIKGDNN